MGDPAMGKDEPLIPARTAFDDNMRPVQLLLNVYRLLACEEIKTSGDLVERLRQIVSASAGEDLLLVHNEIFLGLVRQGAHVPPSDLKGAMLSHLLRQAVVASCTALDAFLPGLLRFHLPAVIQTRGRTFIPADDVAVKEYLADVVFDVHEVMRLIDEVEEADVYVVNKILTASKHKYLANAKGVHTVGVLLGLDHPWDRIAAHLGRDKRELKRVLDETVKRRNDIVHRADRPQANPDGAAQSITYAQAKHGVETIGTVCLTLDELVEAAIAELARQTEDDVCL